VRVRRAEVERQSLLAGSLSNFGRRRLYLLVIGFSPMLDVALFSSLGDN